MQKSENIQEVGKTGQTNNGECGFGLHDISDVRTIKAKPFVKWAGGKWQLIPLLLPYFPPLHKINRYYEPFLGGGAVFFHLRHPYSHLADSNYDLIDLYKTVRDEVYELIKILRTHRNEKEYYYLVRAQDPRTLTPVQRAARFIYLNKTCYNGLYRVNAKGQFNVPFGKYKTPNICDEDGLRAASLLLKNAIIEHTDFENAVSSASRYDFIYLDPPYQPLSKTSSFTGYTPGKFDDNEQVRLAKVFRDLDSKGCYVMLSNSNAPLILELYKDYQINEIQANRAINCKPDGRGKITELVITNYSI